MRLTYGTIKYLPYVRSHLASWLVSLGCSLSADPSITDSGLHQREHPQNLTQSDLPPVDLSVADIHWQIVAEWSRDSTMVGCNRERIGNQHRCFELYGQWLPTTSLYPKRGSQVHPSWYVEFRMAIISATVHPIHFIFRSRVGFSRSADRMALFPVRSNPRCQPWLDVAWQKILTIAERCRLLPNYFGPGCYS